jgi:type IV secretion system protein VirB11
MDQDIAPEEKAKFLRADLGTDFMDLYNDPDITEVGVNPFRDKVWADSRTNDKIETDVVLTDADVQNFLERAAGFNDRSLTPSRPDIECSLPSPIWGGARLSGSVPPAVPSPTFCLRKFEDTLIPLESYKSDGIISGRQYDRIHTAIRKHENIAVVGGTGSGKSTLLMSILNRMGELFPKERFVTIEDTPEISLDTAWNWHPYYTFETNDPYVGTVKDRVHRSLRFSPDRLIVGECRGPGIVALFEALLSGHPGGAFTYHATNIQKFFKRVLINCKRDSDTDAHNHTIGDAVDLVIILEKSQGVRYVKQMAKVEGYRPQTDEFDYKRVYRDPNLRPKFFVPEEVQRKRAEATLSSEENHSEENQSPDNKDSTTSSSSPSDKPLTDGDSSPTRGSPSDVDPSDVDPSDVDPSDIEGSTNSGSASGSASSSAAEDSRETSPSEVSPEKS